MNPDKLIAVFDWNKCWQYLFESESVYFVKTGTVWFELKKTVLL